MLAKINWKWGKLVVYQLGDECFGNWQKKVQRPCRSPQHSGRTVALKVELGPWPDQSGALLVCKWAVSTRTVLVSVGGGPLHELDGMDTTTNPLFGSHHVDIGTL